LDFENAVTLEIGLGVQQGHWLHGRCGSGTLFPQQFLGRCGQCGISSYRLGVGSRCELRREKAK